MNNSWLQWLFLVGTILFGWPTLRVASILIQFLAALFSGAVHWPGPLIHDPNPNVSLGQQQMGLRPEHLFPAFLQNALGLIGACVFFLLSYLSETSWLAGSVQIRWTGSGYCFTFLAFLAGVINSRKALYHAHQVNILLSDIRNKAEPRSIDGASAEAEYAIEHPLLDQPGQTPEFSRALQSFDTGTTYLQAGNQQKAMIFYQTALEADPELHAHAREELTSLANACSPTEAGSIYYWLGAHSEYLQDFGQARVAYEKAIQAFRQVGYKKRESRAHCNLGNVKMRTLDASALDEFEKAIELNPRNGTAHINIGTAFYRISERGDPRFERALDAYAEAIIADPLRYGPIVIARLREIGYTWKEDLEDITQRVEAKRRNAVVQHV